MPELEDDEEWEVEELKDEQVIDHETHFLVKWKGWPAEYNQWVAKTDLHAPKLVAQFRKGAKQKA